MTTIPAHKHCQLCGIVMSFSDDCNVCSICKQQIKINGSDK